MIEIIWHGRGGQGAFTAARLLGAAGSLAPDRYGLAFPSFGPERRGAPMRAFTKLDGSPIGDRSACSKADFVVYLDSTLFGDGWDAELKEGGRALVNTTQAFDDPRIMPIDASGISRQILGRDIPNTVFLAAISVLCDALGTDDAREAIRQYMAPKLHAKNIAIVDHVEALLGSHDGQQPSPENAAAAECDPADAVAPSPAGEDSPAWPAPAKRTIPTLRDNPRIDPAEYAASTCWEAGFLVSKNAGWRTVRPVISTDACRGCLMCYMDCPDGAIYKVDVRNAHSAAAGRPVPTVAIDYDFCKGCGICCSSCRFGAIAMIPEND